MKLLTSIIKELTLLWRDRIGLALLFLMPLIFVVVITLIQNHSATNLEGPQVTILLVNNDVDQHIAKHIKVTVTKDHLFTIKQSLQGKDLTEQAGRRAVALGEFQVLIVVPKGANASIKQFIEQLSAGIESTHIPPPKPITLVFDPNIAPAFQQAIDNALQTIIQQQKIDALVNVSNDATGAHISSHHLNFHSIKNEYAQLNESQLRPNAVQQNVPAWAIFGMFFIVIPVSGTFLLERQYGVFNRIAAAPVSFITVLLGKIIAYVIINLIQLALMLLVGVTLLPALGTPILNFGSHPELIALTGLIVAFAATGFGLLIGTIINSYEQASSLGALLVVIGAAIGGIMIPVYMMPKLLQKISILSPMNWAHSAFIDIFVRGAGLRELLPDLGLLFAFFLISLCLSILFLRKRMTGSYFLSTKQISNTVNNVLNQG